MRGGGSDDTISEASGAGRSELLTLKVGFPDTEFLRSSTDRLWLDFDNELFDWLLFYAIDFFINHLGATGFELRSLRGAWFQSRRKDEARHGQRPI